LKHSKMKKFQSLSHSTFLRKHIKKNVWNTNICMLLNFLQIFEKVGIIYHFQKNYAS